MVRFVGGARRSALAMIGADFARAQQDTDRLEEHLQAKGFLIDVDGTLVSGTKALPDAARLLLVTRGRHVIVSNNAEHTPAQLSKMLNRAGLKVAKEDIVLAGTAAVDHVAHRFEGASVYLLGSISLQRYAAQKGLRLKTERPDVVILGRDKTFTYRKLHSAAAALVDGAHLVVAAPDFNHPGPDGKPVPETGALAAALLACAGEREYTVIGKPERALFDMALARLNVRPAEAMMIGDNPLTDGLGASRLGMTFLDVRNGLAKASPQHIAAERVGSDVN